MSRILDQCLSHGPKIQLLDEQQAARSVVVSNIPPQTTDESIVIYFQRQKNGGGEIDHVHIPKKGTAVITFESSEVVETVTKSPHSLEDHNCSFANIFQMIPQRFSGELRHV
ncbi:positive regulation of interleukin-4-mediated signaling pathway [Desmophyllum pertusum]|uniref:Positive regulation of interleukin-4-mediated signaling pathway n=1 Tax=Desmophyllum pertusum TaxID=174260 RepID=A0A9W9Z5J3_9CNID|nr:positive regulation of interleukin-4-mediated signaling pathway [Desmophyllum pertusum]